MKKTSTYISVILSIVISLLIAAPFGSVFAEKAAASGSGNGEQYKNAIEELKERGDCYEKLGDNTLKEIATGKKLVVEIEEELGKTEKIGDAIIKTCFRVTATKKDDEGKNISMSFIDTKCNLNDEHSIPGEQPAPITHCTKIQLIISDAGTGIFYAYIGMAYRWAASVVGVIAVLVMIVSGIQIAAAGGDAGKVDEAKGRILRALAGLAVLFMSGLILYTINPTFFTK